jgi:hypothetical protein
MYSYLCIQFTALSLHDTSASERTNESQHGRSNSNEETELQATTGHEKRKTLKRLSFSSSCNENSYLSKAFYERSSNRRLRMCGP